jgi:anaerobic magnesium-protoporphyrin IX monomethyl ester cyclase
MDLLISKYGVRHFHLEDDNVGLDTQRLRDLINGIIDKAWDITWDTANGIRLHGLDREMLRGVKASGCTYLEFGIESGSQETLDRIIRKGIRLDEAERVLAACKDVGIDVHALYVVGFPGETQAGIDETFRFARRALLRYDAVPHLCMARPLPGTELHKICEQKGYLTDPVLPDMGSMLRGEVFPRVMIRTEHFGPEDLKTWIRRFNRQVIAICLAKALGWLLRHPQVVPAVVRKFRHDRRRGLREAVKRAFYGGLFFKSNYLNKRLRRRYGRISTGS